jgi:hypothetical protein
MLAGVYPAFLGRDGPPAPLHLSITFDKSALFVQNKPNFNQAKIRLSFFVTSKYEKNGHLAKRENKTNLRKNKRKFLSIMSIF